MLGRARGRKRVQPMLRAPHQSRHEDTIDRYTVQVWKPIVRKLDAEASSSKRLQKGVEVRRVTQDETQIFRRS